MERGLKLQRKQTVNVGNAEQNIILDTCMQYGNIMSPWGGWKEPQTPTLKMMREQMMKIVLL